MKIRTFTIFICSRKYCHVLNVLLLLVAILNETVKYTLKATLKSVLLHVAAWEGTHVVPTGSQAESGPALGTVPWKSLPGLKQLVLTNPGPSLCYVVGQACLVTFNSVSLTLTSTVLCLSPEMWVKMAPLGTNLFFSCPGTAESPKFKGSVSCVFQLFSSLDKAVWL